MSFAIWQRVFCFRFWFAFDTRSRHSFFHFETTHSLCRCHSLWSRGHLQFRMKIDEFSLFVCFAFASIYFLFRQQFRKFPTISNHHKMVLPALDVNRPVLRQLSTTHAFGSIWVANNLLLLLHDHHTFVPVCGHSLSLSSKDNSKSAQIETNPSCIKKRTWMKCTRFEAQHFPPTPNLNMSRFGPCRESVNNGCSCRTRLCSTRLSWFACPSNGADCSRSNSMCIALIVCTCCLNRGFGSFKPLSPNSCFIGRVLFFCLLHVQSHSKSFAALPSFLSHFIHLFCALRTLSLCPISGAPLLFYFFFLFLFSRPAEHVLLDPQSVTGRPSASNIALRFPFLNFPSLDSVVRFFIPFFDSNMLFLRTDCSPAIYTTLTFVSSWFPANCPSSFAPHRLTARFVRFKVSPAFTRRFEIIRLIRFSVPIWTTLPIWTTTHVQPLVFAFSNECLTFNWTTNQTTFVSCFCTRILLLRSKRTRPLCLSSASCLIRSFFFNLHSFLHLFASSRFLNFKALVFCFHHPFPSFRSYPPFCLRPFARRLIRTWKTHLCPITFELFTKSSSFVN